MSDVVKQHLIDPELCIRCYTCEEICTLGAISHNQDNVVVDASLCGQCMDCIAPCPTGSIDNWRIADSLYSVEEQLAWEELPDQADIVQDSAVAEFTIEAFDEDIAALLAEAHNGAGGRERAPNSASKPTVNLYKRASPAEATVQGNFRLTAVDSDTDVRHIILDLGGQLLPVLEGQTIGIIAPVVDDIDSLNQPRLYSVSSPRDGERANTNNLSLTVKREPGGVCSNYLCNLVKGDKIKITGPYGATFMMPNDPQAKVVMICTGTGSAPFRAFTMRRQRTLPDVEHGMKLFFGARTPDSLPYFGPLGKVPDTFLEKHFAFSRVNSLGKVYVQDKLRESASSIAPLLNDPHLYIYICGLKAMEAGVENAFEDIARSAKINWSEIRDLLREQGRYHVETY